MALPIQTIRLFVFLRTIVLSAEANPAAGPHPHPTRGWSRGLEWIGVGPVLQGLLIMRCCRAVSFLALGAGLATALPAVGAEPDDSARLVRQLGSLHFAERQSASQALEQKGAPALDALRRGTQSPDLEVRRRAEEILRRIERQLESTRLLTPRRVHLTYRDVSLSDALADFNKKTGFELRIEGDKAAWAGRKLTLDTGDVTVWEAFAQFSREAGLVEHSLTGGTTSTTKTDAVANMEAELRLLAVRQARVQKLIAGLDGQEGLPDSGPFVLAMVSGKTPALPMCTTGGLRVRALTRATPGWGQTKGTEELTCTLDIAPEPGMAWVGLFDVQVRKAIDDRKQELAPAASADEAPAIPYFVPAPILARRKPQMGLDVYAANDVASSPAQQVDVKVRAGKEQSRCLAELRGVLVGQMQTPPEALLSLPNILQATGKSAQTVDGSSVKVLEVRRESDGEVHVQIELFSVPRAESMPFPARQQLNRLVVWNATASNRPAPRDLCLRDAAGKDFRAVRQSVDQMQFNGQGLVYSVTLHFHPNPGQGAPDRLVLMGRRQVLVEAPFTLHNIPLP
jgi:hypothetical protein